MTIIALLLLVAWLGLIVRHDGRGPASVMVSLWPVFTYILLMLAATIFVATYRSPASILLALVAALAPAIEEAIRLGVATRFMDRSVLAFLYASFFGFAELVTKLGASWVYPQMMKVDDLRDWLALLSPVAMHVAMSALVVVLLSRLKPGRASLAVWVLTTVLHYSYNATRGRNPGEAMQSLLEILLLLLVTAGLLHLANGRRGARATGEPQP